MTSSELMGCFRPFPFATRIMCFFRYAMLHSGGSRHASPLIVHATNPKTFPQDVVTKQELLTFEEEKNAKLAAILKAKNAVCVLILVFSSFCL
jgi:hypothetical protein